MLSILQERDFPLGLLRLFASKRSAGTNLETKWGSVEVENLDTANVSGVNLALFSAGAERSRRYAPAFVEAGAVVVDNSSAFRMEPDVPLVVAQVNDDVVGRHRGIIANPNCTTMTLMMAAAPLHRAAGLVSVVAASYQAVSGSGQRGVEELLKQTDRLRPDAEVLMKGGWEAPEPELYSRPILFNVVPLAGSEAGDGYTDEEMKLVSESRKILDLPYLSVEPTCVRVPILTGHGVAATLRFGSSLGVDEALEILEGAPGVEVWMDRVPTPLDSVGIDSVLVGRVRPTLGEPGGINLWVVGDNLRKGAALNAVQIAELLV